MYLCKGYAAWQSLDLSSDPSPSHTHILCRSRSRSRSRGRRDDPRDSRDRDRDRDSRRRSRSREGRGGGGRDDRRGGGGGRDGGFLPPPPPLQEAPVLGGVYQGIVSGLMDFGCFVEIQGFRRKVGRGVGGGDDCFGFLIPRHSFFATRQTPFRPVSLCYVFPSPQVEGMVHISNLSKRAVSSAKDVVQRGMQV